jgi:hypothetical protein
MIAVADEPRLALARIHRPARDRTRIVDFAETIANKCRAGETIGISIVFVPSLKDYFAGKELEFEVPLAPVGSPFN